MGANFYLDRKGRTDAELVEALHKQVEFRLIRRKPPPYAPDRVYVEAVLRNPLSRRSLIRKEPDGTRQPNAGKPQGSPPPTCNPAGGCPCSDRR